MSLLLRRRASLMGRGYSIPSEYQRVEYIESTGEQWIDTGIKPYYNKEKRHGTKVRLKYQLLENKGSFIIGCRESSFSKVFTHNLTSGEEILWKWQTGGSSNISEITVSNYNSDINETYFDFKTYEWNGNAYKVFANVTFSYDLSLYLFACNQEEKANLPSVMRLYSCQIDNKNFIPCYRKSDGVIGLYEITEGIFYTNQGTGEFLKGGDI